jgi:hypothetical protein
MTLRRRASERSYKLYYSERTATFTAVEELRTCGVFFFFDRRECVRMSIGGLVIYETCRIFVGICMSLHESCMHTM